MSNDSVASMLADLDNKEMHGIDCGRGDFSANSRHHSSNQNAYIAGSSSGAVHPSYIASSNSGAVRTPSMPVNWGLIGIIFCSSWIGLAAQSGKVFGAFFGAVVMVLVIGHFCFKDEKRERFEKVVLFLLGGLSAIGVSYFCYFPWGLEGSIGSLLTMGSLAAFTLFCKKKLAKAFGNLIIKIITFTFYAAIIGLAAYGGYLFMK